MWNSVLDRAKDAARKAQEAAEHIERQLDDSVGVLPGGGGEPARGSSLGPASSEGPLGGLTSGLGSGIGSALGAAASLAAASWDNAEEAAAGATGWDDHDAFYDDEEEEEEEEDQDRDVNGDGGVSGLEEPMVHEDDDGRSEEADISPAESLGIFTPQPKRGDIFRTPMLDTPAPSRMDVLYGEDRLTASVAPHGLDGSAADDDKDEEAGGDDMRYLPEHPQQQQQQQQQVTGGLSPETLFVSPMQTQHEIDHLEKKHDKAAGYHEGVGNETEKDVAGAADARPRENRGHKDAGSEGTDGMYISDHPSEPKDETLLEEKLERQVSQEAEVFEQNQEEEGEAIDEVAEVNGSAFTQTEPETDEGNERLPDSSRDVVSKILSHRSATSMPAASPDSKVEVGGNPDPSLQPSAAVDESILAHLKDDIAADIASMQSQLEQLQAALSEREGDIASKEEELATARAEFEKEKDRLKHKVRETKDEAKRRIGKARERVEEMEKELSTANSRLQTAGAGESQKDEMISALRSEGETLMRKQSQMEQSVRNTKFELRDLEAKLEAERDAKEKALFKSSELEAKLKVSEAELNDARKGETRAVRLVQDLASSREESERKANTILSLEQQVNELSGANRELQLEIDAGKKNAEAEKEQESKDLKRERDSMLSDLESKLRTSEREAAVREDALRHEVGELRKRWQDAVRRADEISIDLQQTSAPLMRQLESTERQHRARASAWADLEMKLRSELEENIMANESLVKERNELAVNLKRIERSAAKRGEELDAARSQIENFNASVSEFETEIKELEDENFKLNSQLEESKREASTSVTKVRNEIMETVLHNEERYQVQVEALEMSIRDETKKRKSLEKELEDLVKHTALISTSTVESTTAAVKPKKLHSAMNQADILHNALVGVRSDSEDDDEDDDISEQFFSPGGSSFAAIEQLVQGLKGAKTEINTLRAQLQSSEETRKNVFVDLAKAQAAAEKLPLYEAKVAELTNETSEKDLEIQGLLGDAREVKTMYRRQLDVLLEEKATTSLPEAPQKANGGVNGSQSGNLANGNNGSPSNLLVGDAMAEMMM